MSETQTPVDEDFLRSFLDLQRKVADISNSSVGKQFTTGDLIPAIGTTRSGALLCDGSTYNRVDYAALSALCITIPALIGDGSTTFTVPDYRGQALAGAGGTFTLGTATGAATVTLTAAQSGVPAHTHAAPTITIGNEAAHTHGTGSAAGFVTATGGGGQGFAAGALTTASPANTGAGSSHTHSGSSSTIAANGAANAASSHSVVQPTLPANIFIVT